MIKTPSSNWWWDVPPCLAEGKKTVHCCHYSSFLRDGARMKSTAAGKHKASATNRCKHLHWRVGIGLFARLLRVRCPRTHLACSELCGLCRVPEPCRGSQPGLAVVQRSSSTSASPVLFRSSSVKGPFAPFLFFFLLCWWELDPVLGTLRARGCTLPWHAAFCGHLEPQHLVEGTEHATGFQNWAPFSGGPGSAPLFNPKACFMLGFFCTFPFSTPIFKYPLKARVLELTSQSQPTLADQTQKRKCNRRPPFTFTLNRES